MTADEHQNIGSNIIRIRLQDSQQVHQIDNMENDNPTEQRKSRLKVIQRSIERVI